MVIQLTFYNKVHVKVSVSDVSFYFEVQEKSSL